MSLAQDVQVRLKRYLRGQRAWSFAHNMATLGAGIVSLVVAALTQVESWPSGMPSKDLTTGGLSLMVSIVTFAATKGAFERKWITNRKTRAALDKLLIEAQAPQPDDQPLRQRLQLIIDEHEKGILGA
jgi:hypothetical protein